MQIKRYDRISVCLASSPCKKTAPLAQELKAHSRSGSVGVVSCHEWRRDVHLIGLLLTCSIANGAIRAGAFEVDITPAEFPIEVSGGFLAKQMTGRRRKTACPRDCS